MASSSRRSSIDDGRSKIDIGKTGRSRILLADDTERIYRAYFEVDFSNTACSPSSPAYPPPPRIPLPNPSPIDVLQKSSTSAEAGVRNANARHQSQADDRAEETLQTRRNKANRQNIWTTVSSPVDTHPAQASALAISTSKSCESKRTIAATPATTASIGRPSSGSQASAVGVQTGRGDGETSSSSVTATNPDAPSEYLPPLPTNSSEAPIRGDTNAGGSGAGGVDRRAGNSEGDDLPTSGGVGAEGGVWAGRGGASSNASGRTRFGVGDGGGESFSTSISGGAGGEEESPAQVSLGSSCGLLSGTLTADSPSQSCSDEHERYRCRLPGSRFPVLTCFICCGAARYAQFVIFSLKREQAWKPSR